ncbi:N-acetylglucosamine kinase [uncultured Bosea sp.]|uniref:N-acetylglucosamine kinase n=1 Tax=uncultured Bosea sp. TaxID=211457 RepID=UPI0025CFE68C|nr:BadF/BadG/BcrA/BcrD ATPase family protein [uncultured Bosea sp.]
MPAPDDSLGLGIETGGTGSRWCLSAPSGVILARGEMEPMTGHVFTQAERDRVSGIFTRLASELAGIGRPSAIIAGVTGLGPESAVRAVFCAILATAFGCPEEKILVVDDMWLGYRARFAPGEGIIVYSGTGSIGYHLAADGDIIRAGGRGVLIDDGGSATWIAAEALRRLLRREDEAPGAGWESALGHALAQALGGASWDAVRTHVYGGDRGSLGLLARAVATAGDAGDTLAAEIFTQAGEELARLALALRARVGSRPVALCGRAATLSPLIAQRFQALVTPPARLDAAQVDVPACAAGLACELARSDENRR